MGVRLNDYTNVDFMKKSYKIEVDCACCAGKMETAAQKVGGVERAEVNYLLQKMTVEFAEGSDAKEVMAEVRRVCRRIEPECEIEY